MIEWLQQLFNTFADDIIEVLPTSPFRSFIDTWASGNNQGLAWLNWFIPVGQILKIFFAWLTCYGIYLLASIIMRWVKVIE